MGKVEGITPTCLLLIPLDLVMDNLFTQCPHISINIDGRMGKEATRVAIATPSHTGKRTMPQRREVYTGETMDARNDGVGRYQR